MKAIGPQVSAHAGKRTGTLDGKHTLHHEEIGCMLKVGLGPNWVDVEKSLAAGPMAILP